ncbi:MAG: DUF4332 domain-containing protein [Anaerolineales bacterium]|jgi:predicted flap endonuclease-1-like 5' DNA nuclease|nr:DUF4332 domain-containing protein [Anaerolineales bacterium]
MTALTAIEGIASAYATKLKAAGVGSTEALLKAGATAKGRKELAGETGISDKLILEWVNRADLFRVNGIGEEYSDLLETSGVDTVPELAQRNAENLYKKMVEMNEAKKIVRKLPTQNQIQGWIDSAKSLARVVEY